MPATRPTPADEPTWVIVPVKGGGRGKSRLTPPAGVDRQDLARALALDTLEAVCRAVGPATVVVVTSDESVVVAARAAGVVVCADPGTLLDAVAVGLGVAPQEATRAVLLGDLPALRPHDLTAGLALASGRDRAFVPDRAGSGTTLLVAGAGVPHDPAFGPGSATAHADRGYVRLDEAPHRLRADVDDEADLRVAVALGVGRHTRRALADEHRYAHEVQGSVHTFDVESGSGSVLLDDGREVAFDGRVFEASSLRLVRPGQRLSIVLGPDGQHVTRLWIVGIGADETIR